MFVELMPLLAGRTVLITMAKVDDKTLRVNVIPTQAKADENPALTTPLTYTGPPEELDAELGKHLAGYVQTHQQTTDTLAEAKATMEAAAKAAQEEAKRRAEERKKAPLKSPHLSLLLPRLPLSLCPLQLHPAHSGHFHRQRPNLLQSNQKDDSPSDGKQTTVPLLRIQWSETP